MDESIPIIDVTFGISQLGGDESLFHRMLFKFSHEFAETPSTVKQAISSNNFEEAKIQVHTTKGISGNLGLAALYECSKVLDKQIKDKAISDATLNEFDTVMQETCEAIEHLDIVESPTADLSGEATQEAFYSLSQKLERHEFIDDAELHTLVSGLALSDDDKTKVVELIEELQYEKALVLLERCKDE
ncbi:Hpt domain-containing protein [Agaribacter marinus]|uniref:HPt domain-containing protein n=1 Tax=Agaribacter marinus TaxID=1431249 RepID=A0AA37SWZ3_9ALTE|nr:Hpt domain-containing protein [Agaribacter marinus]GLR70612.1 hypothetical protein GCM10007852_15200 [Agaribacter marinus]